MTVGPEFHDSVLVYSDYLFSNVNNLAMGLFGHGADTHIHTVQLCDFVIHRVTLPSHVTV